MTPGILHRVDDEEKFSSESAIPLESSKGWKSLSVDDVTGIARSPCTLHSADLDEIHDLVGVGFGPASLSIAVALHDSLRDQKGWMNGHAAPRVRFLERQSAFKWHAGMLLPGAKMQISFLKDLATLRDPTSHFTFLNYLKERGRLVQFANLGTFLPSRLEFDDYLQWAASHFANIVEYSQSVESIHPHQTIGSQKHDCFEVVSRDLRTGKTLRVRTRNVVIAAGGRPAIPAVFPQSNDQVLHSSEYNTKIEQLLPDQNDKYRIAVVGGGQSAAEVFSNLHSRYPNATTKMLFRDSALRPSDDSPFINEVFNPEAVNIFFEQPEEFRSADLKKNKATNYSVVRIELLEKIYDHLYLQSIRQPDKQLWQHQILPLREILKVVDDTTQRTIDLILKNLNPSSGSVEERLSFDAVIVATGYRRDGHIDMLRDCQSVNGDHSGRWVTGRDYGLHLDRASVEHGTGIWLQGCNEDTHGLSDTLLSILSTRSGELVRSIFEGNIKPL